MAFYKSKYTGTEIDQRLTQGTYDDAVKAGFTGSKEEFDKIIVAFDENAQQKLDAAQPKIDHRLETLNKSIVDAINELHDEVNQKQDIGDYADKGEFEVFKDEVAATYATKGQVSEETDRAKQAEEKLSNSITTVNSNLVNSINILNKNVSDSLNIVNEAIQQSAETLVAEIEQRKEADSNLQTSISQETTAREALEERVSTLENADYQTGDDVTEKINEVIDNAPEELNTLKKIADSLNNDPDFATTMTTELSKKLDSDKLLAGAGIDVREEDGKKIVDISEGTLTKIQYADSEVRRLEKDKIPYAYDEKTQSNINVILPEGGSYLGNYGDENAIIAKAAVYDGVKQLELGSSKVHTNINTDSDVTIETSDGKKVIATTDQIPDVSDPYEINLTNLLSAEDSESISTAIGGIDNLNATVQDNRIIVGTISNGSVLVSIRILGNVTTLYYLLDSVVGLTLNEVAITNTSGTLSKSVTTHSVLTENMVINSLTSDETTLPLSAAQGKALNETKQSKEDNSLATTAKTVVGAIAELKNAVDSKASSDAVSAKQNATDQSLQTIDKTIVGAINEILPKATGVGKVDPNSDGTGEIFNSYEGTDSNRASGDCSHAEGSKNNAAGKSSHVEGEKNNAAGDYSHAEGYNTTASGKYAHAEGNGTTASGEASHVEGYYTKATSTYSHAEGYYTQTFSEGEHAEGKYNKSYGTPSLSIRVIHSVGIGFSNDDRKNAHEIKLNGDHYIYGVGGFDGTNATSEDSKTLQEVINSKQETITPGTGLEFEGNTLNVTLDTTVFKVVSALPDSPAVGDENKIHLVPAESTGPNNTYTEYVWVNSAWEILGEYTSEVDLTPYLKTVDAQATYATKTELTAHTRNTSNPHGVTADQVGLGNVDNTSDLDKPISTATQAALDLKQDITDNTLETTSKTVPGAINETKERIDNIDQTLDLKKVFAYGVEWTDEGVLTSSALTRIGNLQMHKDLPIQSAMYGCIVKNGALQYKLGATNWTYKEDMTTASVLDGTDGGIYVHIPKFYLWSENEGITHRVYISLLPLVPDALEVPEMYVSAEKVTLDRTDGSNIKTASVVNTTANFRGGNNSADYDTYLTTDPARCLLGKPATNVSRANMRTYARNNGEELLCYDWYKALYWLYVIEYANFNCQLAYNAELTAEGYKQGGLGLGVTNLVWDVWGTYNKQNPIVPCGYNYEIGNGTGIKNLTLVGYNENAGITTSVPRWRGLCSPFGDIWTNIEGIYIQQTTEGVEYKSVYATHNPDYFGEVSNHMDYIGGEVRQEGYIQSVNLGNQADIIPLTVGGGANTGMCDYHWIGSDNTTARILLMGGRANYGSQAGFSYWTSGTALAGANSRVGFRTVIIK